MKHYYALFKKTNKAVEVEFPDLQGCVTFGKIGKSIRERRSVLIRLTNAEAIHQRTFRASWLSSIKGELCLYPWMKILYSYRKLKRFNVIFPAKVLQIDTFRKKKLKFCGFTKAAEIFTTTWQQRKKILQTPS